MIPINYATLYATNTQHRDSFPDVTCCVNVAQYSCKIMIISVMSLIFCCMEKYTADRITNN